MPHQGSSENLLGDLTYGPTCNPGTATREYNFSEFTREGIETITQLDGFSNAVGQAPTTFCDVAAHFADEEWELLYEWQKELYRNLMKEIHQALMSLGPLIATSVFSLRPKGNDQLPSWWHQDFEMRSNVKAQSDQTAESDASFRETRRANLFLKDVKNSSERQQRDDPNRGPTDETQVVSVIIKEEAAMYSIDNFGPERRDSIASNTTGFPFENAEIESRLQHYESTEREESDPCLKLGPDVTTAISSVGINEEGVGCTFDIEAHRRRERMSKPAGQGFMKRKSKEEVSEKYAERNITRKYSSGKVKMIQKCDKGTSYKRHLWPESKQKVGVEIPQCETVLSSKTHSNSHQGTHNVGRLTDPNEYASSLWNAQTLVAPANVIVHQRAQKDLCPKERYFHCTECNKSFIQKVHLIRHQRTHSGERPFHCTECEKSFSQKHHLLGHLRTHSGEKPFQCTKCMKSFSWKEGLYRHQRTHLFQKFSHT